MILRLLLNIRNDMDGIYIGSFNKLHLIIHQILTLKTFYKKFTAKPYSFFLIEYILERIQTLIDDEIRNEKLRYDFNRVNREAAKISPLSIIKTDKYEHLTDEAILPSNQSRIIEQGKFTYSTLGKALGKTNKNS